MSKPYILFQAFNQKDLKKKNKNKKKQWHKATDSAQMLNDFQV